MNSWICGTRKTCDVIPFGWTPTKFSHLAKCVDGKQRSLPTIGILRIPNLFSDTKWKDWKVNHHWHEWFDHDRRYHRWPAKSVREDSRQCSRLYHEWEHKNQVGLAVEYPRSETNETESANNRPWQSTGTEYWSLITAANLSVSERLISTSRKPSLLECRNVVRTLPVLLIRKSIN